MVFLLPAQGILAFPRLRPRQRRVSQRGSGAGTRMDEGSSPHGPPGQEMPRGTVPYENLYFTNFPSERKTWLPADSCLVRRSVAAEEGILPPLRAVGGIGGVEQQSPGELFVAGGGFEIDRLVHVVGRGVVAVGEPVLEDFLFGCAELEADVDLHGGNTFLDEAVLVAANEAVAQRLGVGDGLDAHGLGDGRGTSAEVRFIDALDG